MKNGVPISYGYDAGGNRIVKTANGTTTVYVRDAQGNVLSVYEAPAGSSSLVQKEIHLYGRNRLGMLSGLSVPTGAITYTTGLNATLSTFTRGERTFELANHLGNVLTNVSDKKVQHNNGNGGLDYYLADILSAQDYYPFGMLMPKRQYTLGNKYRYGFNGKENDNEIKGEGNELDYGMRIYDSRLGHFLSVDPLQKQYAYFTPYQFSGNTPIQAIDLDGLEPKGYSPYGDGNNDARVKLLPSSYDKQASEGTIGDYKGIINAYAVQDVDKKTYVIFEDVNRTRQWYVEYDKDGWKGNVNSFAWQSPPNPADVLTTMIITPMIALPGGIIYGGAAIESGSALIYAQYVNIGTKIYPWLPAIGYYGNKAIELMDESGSIPSQNEAITFRAKDVLSASFAHIFSDKHVKNGLELFGKSESEILSKIENIVKSNLGSLKEGDNFIETTINGLKGTVKAFVKDNEIKSVNAVSGEYIRKFNNVIQDINSN